MFALIAVYNTRASIQRGRRTLGDRANHPVGTS